MKFFTKNKFVFKLIVCLCLCLTIMNVCVSIKVYADDIPQTCPEDGNALYQKATNGGGIYRDGAGITCHVRCPHGLMLEANAMSNTGLYTFSDGCQTDQSGQHWSVPNPENPDSPTITGPAPITSEVDVSDAAEALLGVGGKLLTPVVQLCTALGDAVMNIIHDQIMGTTSELVVNTSKGFWAKVAAIFAAIAMIAVLVLATVATGGLSGILASVAVGVIGVIKVPLVLGVAAWAYVGVQGSGMPEVTLLPMYSIGPEEIFKGKILLFDVNIFDPKEVYVEYTENGATGEMPVSEWNKRGESEEVDNKIASFYFFYDESGEKVITSTNNAAYDLKNAVTRWYYTFRNLAIVALMIVLVYVGIRILISSSAADKSKYKEMFMDWLIGICLVFLMHYIMVFAINLTQNITNLLSSVAGETHHVVKIVDANEVLIQCIEKDEKLKQTIDGNNINWTTNLMGKIRILAQQQDGTFAYIGFSICFLVLVFYTVIFAFTYLKRVLYLMFLTIIAPLVAVSYPLDKIRDGRAQGFDMWLKEYIINLLIQPLHLLLYILLVSMAIDLSATNVIYSLVALGFMMPAEKFVRKMFGFDRASSPGFLSGAAGAAIAMNAIHSLSRFAQRGIGGGDKGPRGLKEGNNNSNDFLDRASETGNNNSALIAEMAKENKGEELKDDNNKKENNNKEQDQNQNKQRKQDLLDGEEGQNQEPQFLTEDEMIEKEQLGEYLDNNDKNTIPPEEMEQWDNNYNRYMELQEKEEQERARLTGEIDDDDTTEEQPPQEEPLPEEQPTILAESPEDTGRYRDSRFGRVGRAINGTLNNGKVRYVAKESLRTMGRTIGTGARVFTGAAGGIIGASAGVASGSPGDIVKNTAMGATAGAAIGGGVVKTATNIGRNIYSGGVQARNEMRREVYGPNYGSAQRKEKDAQFKRNKEMRRLYASKLGLEGNESAIDAAMDDAIKYREYGVTDNKIILEAMTMDNGNQNNRANADRIAAARMANVTKTENDFQRNFERFAKAPGLSKTQLKTLERRVRRITGL